MQVAVVLIKDATVDSRKVGDNTFYSQRGVLQTGPDEALGIEVSLRRGQEPYAPGRYTFDGESFDRDKYGRPCFSSRGLKLMPLAAQPQAK